MAILPRADGAPAWRAGRRRPLGRRQSRYRPSAPADGSPPPQPSTYRIPGMEDDGPLAAAAAAPPPAPAAPPPPANAPSPSAASVSASRTTTASTSPLPTTYLIPGYVPGATISGGNGTTNGTAPTTFLGMSKTNWIIIGASVGTIVVIVLAALIISFCLSWCYRERAEPEERPTEREMRDVSKKYGEGRPSEMEEKSLLKNRPIISKPGFPEHGAPALTGAEAQKLVLTTTNYDDDEGEQGNDAGYGDRTQLLSRHMSLARPGGQRVDDGRGRSLSPARSSTDPDFSTKKGKPSIFSQLKSDYARARSRSRQRDREGQSADQQ
ncbi:hypothetical protein DFJ74DRAFT_759862 [Hyaloraphidium curvatum]|nr:hypothetical protein DFJ74DRAFT_759862 [Hyaloraphidium curvatum]